MTNIKTRNKNMAQRRAELSEYFDCIVKGCERHSFTQRGLEMHIKARHPDFYDKWQWQWKATTSEEEELG